MRIGRVILLACPLAAPTAAVVLISCCIVQAADDFFLFEKQGKRYGPYHFTNATQVLDEQLKLTVNANGTLQIKGFSRGILRTFGPFMATNNAKCLIDTREFTFVEGNEVDAFVPTSFPIVRRSTSPFVQPTNTFDHAWANGSTFFPQSDPKLVKGREWEDMRDEYETKLVNLAKDMKLDHTALAAFLKVALDDKRNKNLAVVPVAACQVNGTNDTIWVISCVWEVAEWVVETWVEEKRRSDKLGHVRAFAVSSKTKTILAFFTCD